MADMSSLQVEADVSESNIEKIRLGQPAEIALDAYPDTKSEGVVQTIVPTADRAKATVMTKIRFLNLDDRILPEMSAKVAFLADPEAGQGGAPMVVVQPGRHRHPGRSEGGLPPSGRACRDGSGGDRRLVGKPGRGQTRGSSRATGWCSILPRIWRPEIGFRFNKLFSSEDLSTTHQGKPRSFVSLRMTR
ncbi:MAG: efflux RND transporter periplasmic adaptor subunit [Candidatus Manganitrophus sp.]|nr:efflux RND transporter periplasmic adaptor subunit [Candidatus Manganitrophus sp.]